jgi:ribonuclease I
VNNVTALLFILSTAALGGAAFALMWRNLKSINEMPMRNYRQGEWTTEVTKRIHPEMQDVEPGTQLLGVNFEKKTECDIEQYKELQNRISKLKDELSDPWIDDEEDDDGDIVVRV